jgi:hypothetical protein
VPEHPSSWFVKDEIPQLVISFDPFTLFPKSFAGRRRNSSNYHIPNLALSMARDDMDYF